MANGVKIFGFEIKKSAEVKRETEPLKDASVVPPTDDDGAGYVTSGANHYGMAMDIYGDLTVKDQHDLIRKYRIAAQQPEVDMAIEEIVNEAIVVPQTNDIVVDIDLDLVDISPSIKKKVTEEFEHLLNIIRENNFCPKINIFARNFLHHVEWFRRSFSTLRPPNELIPTSQDVP